MKDQLKMLNQMTFEDSLNVISSPASVDGVMPLNSLAGPKIEKSGLVAVPANLSPRQAKELGLLTSGICGRHSIGSFESVSLRQSLENKLRVKLAQLGSMLFRLTWKTKAMPSGRLYSQLVASGHRISDKEHGSWPTTSASDHKGGYGGGENEKREVVDRPAGCSGAVSDLANSNSRRFKQLNSHIGQLSIIDENGESELMADSDLSGTRGNAGAVHSEESETQRDFGFQDRFKLNSPESASTTHWSAADWIYCKDGKYRPVEPGTFPLAYGVSGRVGLLRGYGNAIVPQVAKEVIEAFMEVELTPSADGAHSAERER